MLLYNALPLFASGLSGVSRTFINSWAGPLFIIVVAAVSIVFLVRREFRALFSFIAIAAVVGIMVYKGGDWFGGSGHLSRVANSTAYQVNTIIPTFVSTHFPMF